MYTLIKKMVKFINCEFVIGQKSSRWSQATFHCDINSRMFSPTRKVQPQQLSRRVACARWRSLLAAKRPYVITYLSVSFDLS